MEVAKGAPAAFFSYCREDSGFALKLAGDLKAAGANVWLDQLDILPGQRWDRSVEEALSDCQRMVVILSPASVSSVNVMDEVSFALETQKIVIPVLYQDCTVPFRLRRVQHVDFRQDYARGLQELVRTMPAEHSAEEKESTRSDPRTHSQSHVDDAEKPRPGAEQAQQNERRKSAGRARNVLIRRLIATGAIIILAVSSWVVFHSRSVAPHETNTGIAHSIAQTGNTRNALHSSVGTSIVTQVEAVGSDTIPTSPPYPPDPPPAAYPSDEFQLDDALNSDIWATGTPLLASIAEAQGLRLVPAQLSFNRTGGMTVSGVTGKYQFTGVQSRQSIRPPFAMRATALGTVANGYPIAFYLINADLSEYLLLSGNLNPRNGYYHGISLGSTPNTGGLKHHVGHKLGVPASAVDIGRWYGIAVEIAADGTGGMTLTDGGGKVLATEGHLHVGRGPFYVVIAQGEGWPYTIGVNKAVWSWLKTSHGR